MRLRTLGQRAIDALAETGRFTAFRETVRLIPHHAEAHCNLGQLLLHRDQPREGLPELRRGHEIGSQQPGWAYPTGQWVVSAERRMAEEEDLEAQLAGHMAAGTQPEDPSDLVALARVALDQNRPALAARWYHEAFEQSPDFADAINAGHRRRGARAAVLASIGGTDSAPALDDTARTTWRLRALTWLEAETAVVRKESNAKRSHPRDVRLAMVPLTRTPDLASVREPDALSRLPDAERSRWTNLWTDIDALLASLDRKPECRTPESRRERRQPRDCDPGLMNRGASEVSQHISSGIPQSQPFVCSARVSLPSA